MGPGVMYRAPQNNAPRAVCGRLPRSPIGDTGSWRIWLYARRTAIQWASALGRRVRRGRLLKAAREGRWGHRDATLITVAYRHGLRAKEACELEWSQVEFGRSAALHVRRAKQGKPAVHPIRGDELRMLTALRKAQPDSGYVFTSERGTPFTPDAM